MPNIKRKPSLLALVPFFLIAQYFAVLLLTRRKKYDVIHGHWLIPQGLTMLVIPKRVGTKMVLSGHGSDLFMFAKSRVGSSVLRSIAKKVDVVTANSSATGKVLEKLRAKYSIIPMGVDVNRFNAKMHNPGSGSRILFVGRLIPVKGIEYLIKAMPKIASELPTVKLQIVGDGTDKERLVEMANSMGVNQYIGFSGRAGTNELPEIYQNADVFVGPSIQSSDGSTEAFGVVYLEALASGLPVVASDVGGVKDIVENGKNGILVQQKSSEEIAEAVINILKNPELAKSFAMQGRKTVEDKFSWPRVAQQFEEIYA